MNFASRNRKYSSIDRISTRKVSILPTKEQQKVDKHLFSGFIPGDAFRTRKGYVGAKLDSLWGRYILESYVNDDIELANIALDSCLADITIIVEGGEYGTPYMIGGHGFYAKTQFQQQSKVLQENERQLMKEIGTYYLSMREWEYVDARLGRYAQYGNARVEKATRGDNLVYLAIREAAFEVAQVCITRGAETMKVNEDNETIMDLIQQRYAEFSDNLRSIYTKLENMMETAIVPTEMEDMLAKDERILNKLKDMRGFLIFLGDYFTNRLKQVEQDKWLKRKAELRREEPSFEIKWNISQEENILKYREMSSAMAQSIVDRINLHTDQLNSLDIRNYYKKQQELLHHIANNNIDPSQLSESKSILPSRAVSALSTVTSSSRYSSPPDSPISRTSTIKSTIKSNTDSKAFTDDNESNSGIDFLSSQYSDYSSVLPKGLASTKKSSRASSKIAHAHRLQTTYTINENGERVYEMSALPPDPRAQLDDTNGYIKPNTNDDEKMVFR